MVLWEKNTLLYVAVMFEGVCVFMVQEHQQSAGLPSGRWLVVITVDANNTEQTNTSPAGQYLTLN